MPNLWRLRSEAERYRNTWVNRCSRNIQPVKSAALPFDGQEGLSVCTCGYRRQPELVMRHRHSQTTRSTIVAPFGKYVAAAPDFCSEHARRNIVSA
jgi:hypothetical protein